jgi:hypothetical protein
LRKLESSTLKECGEEKAIGALHPKCRSERKKVISFPSLHFFFFSFFSLCFPFFSFVSEEEDAKEKALETKEQKQEPKMGAKSERAE